jgi:hypothetical protein
MGGARHTNSLTGVEPLQAPVPMGVQLGGVLILVL